MRVLFATGIAAHRLLPPRLAEEQTICGPDWLDHEIGGYFTSFATPLGEYDLAQAASRLAFEQKPDAVVCRVDANWRALPRHLGAFACPKVLFVAGPRPPLAEVLRYAREEPFDRIVFLHSRRHAEQFRSVGMNHACWFPALDLPHRDADFAIGRQAERELRIALAGSASHPARGRLSAALAARNLALEKQVLGWEERLDLYASSLIGLNQSGDDEFDLRIFEILAGGALLLSDRFAQDSGLADLWREGREIVTYGTEAELGERAAYFLSRPDEARVIGEAGRRWYADRFGEARRRSAFLDLLATGRVPPEFELSQGSTAIFDFAGRVEAPPPAAIAPETIGVSPRGQATADAATSPEELKTRAARDLLEQGEYDEAFALTQTLLVANPRSLDALLIMAELLRECGNVPLCKKTLAMARRLSATDSRISSLELVAGEPRLAQLVFRKMRYIRTLCEQHRWEDAILKAQKVVDGNYLCSEAMHAAGEANLRLGNGSLGAEWLRRAAWVDPARVDYWLDLGYVLRRNQAVGEAAAAFARAVDRDTECVEGWLALGEAAVALDQPERAADAFARVVERQPENALAIRWLESAQRAVRPALSPTTVSVKQPERDLLLVSTETNDRHGQGIVLQRYFPDSSRFVSLRCFSHYKGEEKFGGTNLQLKISDLAEAEMLGKLRRLLAPYAIRRILCVPYYATDFLRAVAVKKITGARLCTFTMDDRVMYPNKVNAPVSTPYARELFAASDLRLTISSEMREAYQRKFGLPFDLLPPTLNSAEGQVPNHWRPEDSPANRCVLVGNIWTIRQLDSLRRMARTSRLQVDWFREFAPNLAPGSTREQLEQDGIFCRGFLPTEDELADRLATYPFALLPSGNLDGTEDDEWLTRLSFPSRISFILVRTLTPMLVLGHPATVAGRFITRCGLGLCTSGAPEDVRFKLARMQNPHERARFLANARRTAPCLVLPDSGEWIWRSLAAGRAEPAPFDELFSLSNLPPREAPEEDSPRRSSRSASEDGPAVELRQAI